MLPLLNEMLPEGKDDNIFMLTLDHCCEKMVEMQEHVK